MKPKIRVPHFISLAKDMKSFFTERKTQILAASLSCALVLSFSFVAISRFEVNNGQSLLASVANLQNNSVQSVVFDADIALLQKKASLELVAGKAMEKVDMIEGIIALNPSLGVKISSNTTNLVVTEESEGMYRFHLDFAGKNISAGQSIAHFTKNSDKNIPLTFIDTQFVSGGERYNLSNIVE